LEIEEQAGPRPGHPPGDGWSRLRPADKSTKIEIQFEEHYTRPVWPGAPGTQGMQMHLDIWVEDVPPASNGRSPAERRRHRTSWPTATARALE
jgi:hypothetical protein